jgi:integrase
VPYFPSLPVDNVRSGFFERAEVDALLQHVDDEGLRDFIAWGFRTGMRKGEIARLTWDMLDRTGAPWVLRIPAAITKNRTGRVGLEGDVKAIIERRLRVRRFDLPLIFHRVCKGKPGQPITDFWDVWRRDVWRRALLEAGLPSGRLFHDVRRSAVRTLIRAGVDETTAMKVSGHKTRSMLLRYNIVTERETADALVRADALLSTQPARAENEKGQLRDILENVGGKSLAAKGRDGSSGRIRTGEDPPTPDDSDPLDPGHNAT